MKQFNFNTIATIHSCYKEKFGIPRQPGLVASTAIIEFEETYSEDEAFRELENFSHIWVVFVFHGLANKAWKATVRPPRLGGNQRVGVFATRSMFRPNPIGLSVVELESIERKKGKIILNIIGGDFLDATPVLDVKPYIPYADSIKTLNSGYAKDKPEVKFSVRFSKKIKNILEEEEANHPTLAVIIREILQLDPRPAYKNKKQTKNEFSMKLYNYDLKWKVENEEVVVTELTLLD